MTFALGKTNSAPIYEPLTEQVPDFGDTFSAGVEAERIEIDSWHNADRTARAYHDELKERLGEAYGDGPQKLARRRARTGGPSLAEDIGYVTSRVEQLQTGENRKDYADLPVTPEAFNAEVTRRLKAEHDDATLTEIMGPGSASFLGRLWAGTTDESTVMSLPLAPLGGGGVRATIALEAALGASAEALTLPRQYEVAERLDLAPPNPILQMALGGATAGVLGGGIAGTQRYLHYRKTQRQTTTDRRIDPDDQLAFGSDTETAQNQLAINDTAIAVDQSAPDPAWTFRVPAVPSDWAAIRAGIFVGESGGDYNALFGYQNRAGGRFSDVRITEMTVDEAIEFANPSGPYGQWVKSRIGRVATPMGAYQIVGTTLRNAKAGLGLRGDEQMTVALQESLAHWIYYKQGTGAWEGYRGKRNPNTTFADRSNQPAPTVAFGTTTPTSRAFTRDGQVTAGNNRQIDVDYQVVDASTLQRASGDLQPRDRSRAASDEQIAEIAAGLDPARLLPSPEADRGAPIVGPDNIIESGNGRVAAIAQAYDRFPDRAAAYRNQLETAGFSIPAGVDRPVLVARRRTELSRSERSEFVRDANTSSIARMSATERSAVDARALSSDVVGLYDPSQPLNSSANRGFTQRALASLPQTERAALVDAKGQLNAEGVQRLQQALFARAYDAPDILARYAETDAGDLRSLMAALELAAPKWAALRDAVARGEIEPEFDLTPYVLDAMRLIATARQIASREGKSVVSMVDELTNDVDLLEGATSPVTAALVRKFMPNGRAASADKVGEFLNRYADEAMKVGQTGGSLLDDIPTPLDVLRAIDPQTFGEVEDMGSARIVSPSDADLETVTFANDNFSDGASSPEVEAAADQAVVELSAREDLQTLQVEMPDGTTVSARELLEDLDADDNLVAVLDACNLGSAA